MTPEERSAVLDEVLAVLGKEHDAYFRARGQKPEAAAIRDVIPKVMQMKAIAPPAATQPAEEENKFKSYVHKRLDDAGVPHDPDPEHNAKHGCRIEGRLNWVLSRMAAAEQEGGGDAGVVREIAAERERQKSVEGWSEEHDDAHADGALASAAACYADDRRLYRKQSLADGDAFWDAWPWDKCWDKRKKHDRRRQLVIAGALIVAEIERLDRLAADSAKPPAAEQPAADYVPVTGISDPEKLKRYLKQPAAEEERTEWMRALAKAHTAAHRGRIDQLRADLALLEILDRNPSAGAAGEEGN